MYMLVTTVPSQLMNETHMATSTAGQDVVWSILPEQFAIGTVIFLEYVTYYYLGSPRLSILK